jgi:hypothetical protein
MRDLLSSFDYSGKKKSLVADDSHIVFPWSAEAAKSGRLAR